MHRRRSAVFIERSAHIHAPCPPFTSLTAGVLTFTHLARRSLPLRRRCSHSRTLKSAPWRCAFISGVPGGSACLRAPCPPFTSLTAAVLTFTNLARLLKSLASAKLLWRSRRECSLARTLPAVKKERISPSFDGVPGGSAHIHEPYRRNRRNRPGGCAHNHAP